MDISVILPVYNERQNLELVLAELEEVLTALGRQFEVIAVDDGSTDGSRELLLRLATQKTYLRLIFFRKNCGQTAAFDAGFHAASGDVLVTMDSDLQNDSRDIPAMIAKLDEGYDFVTGWRKYRQDGFFLRKIPSKIANWIIRKITGTRVHDLGCSLKVYRRALTEEMHLYGEKHRFISVIADSLGARVCEVEVNHRVRHAGRSKYGLSRTVKVLLDLTTISFMHRYQTKPIYVFGASGIGLILMSALMSVYVLWEKLSSDIYVHRNPLFMVAVVLFLTGVQLVGLGIVAEMIVRSYYESDGKRPYSIQSKIGFDQEA
ncbi:MAG: glycosyltransferase family 2 protein [Myxococcota bacterium]